MANESIPRRDFLMSAGAGRGGDVGCRKSNPRIRAGRAPRDRGGSGRPISS